MPAFHVSLGALRSSRGLTEPGGGGGVNGQQLSAHKSSRSIVSGEPPAARADVVPIDRS